MDPEPSPLRDAPTVLALDVDGVLLDPSRGGLGPWKATLPRRFGIDPDDLRRSFFAPHWQDIVTGRDPVLPRLAAALDDLGATVRAQDVLDHWLTTDFVVDTDAVTAVRAWVERGVPVVLATNQEHERARFLARELRTHVPHQGIAWSALLGVTKDDPDFYRRARTHLGIVATTEIVFVDDDPVNVRTAAAAGWHAVLRSDGDSWKAAVDARLSAPLDDRR